MKSIDPLRMNPYYGRTAYVPRPEAEMHPDWSRTALAYAQMDWDRAETARRNAAQLARSRIDEEGPPPDAA